ncbi:MAG: HAD family hydrolase [Lachnospiraceae bacterium]|nr:HAD family hydrolase [Lachnospiraceae bacterium]
MKNTAIFFDLDDTLYDRSQPFREAFRQFLPLQSDLDLKAYDACNHRGDEVFHASQRGEITMDEMYIYRYTKGFSDIGISMTDDDALRFQELYKERQGKICIGEGVPELLDYCTANFSMVGIITNGPEDKQKRKLQTLGLSRWIPEQQTIISGVVKVDKPDPAIFHLAEKMAGKGPESMLYVGDSFVNDMAPAIALGWKTIYLNRKAQAVPVNSGKPDLELRGEEFLRPSHLKQLL